MRAFVPAFLLLAGVASAACAPAHREAVAPRQLYFAVELYRDGHKIGTPRLLGETGRTLRAERRQPGASLADYALTLNPQVEGDRYRIDVELQLPEIRGQSELALLHGEMRRIELGRNPGDLSVSLTLMEVDSPEFRALMELAGAPAPAGRGSI